MGEPWYVQSFKQDYLKIYAHRNDEAAEREVNQIVNLLDMEKGSAVLDLCCGQGRHSRALARRGFQVTGLDLSSVLLAEAEKRSAEYNIRYVQGDVRKIPFEHEFDYILNLFTSFGYFEKWDDNLSVFRGIRRALQTNGQFLIDFLNPEYVKHNLKPYTEREAGQLHIIERRQIQGKQVVKTIEVREGEEARHYKEQVQLFTYEEMAAMLKEAGLEVTKVYGSLERQAYDPVRSPRMIIIGKRG
ncbi:ubiquinone/menaquinone biosynthesis C-methylase UbiE [Caldalkalibacillus uzonensis]|uniref:Ubiquinone/menaquinone biosynthesis C-methylase UbiE n=1 Tax=Caldalkalibacillus uzonensis TaxID=353224 RepID=A0ABU0CW82_9BACI|nr:class I SAM-dependent methyltransferase [Caldalkalibacillus uzonensis]MDQ0339780.1 ubiquinone/menaquinone biosynthesis C-methylase UbiE [Caldalkalibacillus uzonensis]